jgi:hypothetical protein
VLSFNNNVLTVVYSVDDDFEADMKQAMMNSIIWDEDVEDSTSSPPRKYQAFDEET